MYENVNFPGWEVVRKIGEGSFGGVYEIHRTLPDGRVEKAALKKLTVPKDNSEIRELYSQSFSKENITAHYKDQMRELVNEYTLTQELNGCRNVVACHDVQCVQHTDGIGWDIYIRMELLRPLKHVLSADYQEMTVLKLGLSLCNALLACQEHHIVHRDIKPENILVSDRGEFKLGDFGIAKVSEKTATGTMTGTMGYMAPEVANRWHYGAQADIYSLGMVLYWMMNRRTLPFLPFPPTIPTAAQRQEAANRRFAGEDFSPPVNGSRELKAIVMKACAFSTDKRYQTVRELRRDLYACYQQRRAGKTADVSTPADTDEAVLTNEPTLGNTYSGSFHNTSQNEKTGTSKNNTSKTGRFAAPPVKPKKRRVALICVLAALCLCFVAFLGYLLVHREHPAVSTPGTVSTSETVSAPSAVSTPRAVNQMQSDPVHMNTDTIDGLQVFHTGVLRMDVASITFLDTTADAPGDSWDISEDGNGSVLAWVTGQAPEYDLYIAGEGGVRAPKNCFGLFGGYIKAKSISFGTAFDTSEVTDMSYMFASCVSLTNLDVRNFNTSRVTNMKRMFGTFSGMGNPSDSSFDTLLATLYGCNDLTALDLSSFDTSHVTNMMGMFCRCNKLSSLDISSFDTSLVTDMSYMFSECNEVSSLDVSGFDTSLVTDMSGMFAACEKLTNLDVSKFGTSLVTDMSYMFAGCEKLTVLDVHGFDTSHVTDMQSMFGWCSELSSLDVSNFDTSLVTDMSGMFDGCEKLTDLDLSGFDFSNVVTYDNFMDDRQLYNGQPWEKLFTDGSSNSSFRSQTTLAAHSLHTAGLRSDGTVIATGANEYGQCNVDSWTDIVAVTAGDCYTVGLHSDGTVVAVGHNQYNECDLDSWADIAAVAAGFGHTVGLRSDGTVVATGLNNEGQCDVDSWTDIIAVATELDHTVGLRSDGTVVAAGWNKYGQCDVDSWTDIVAVAAGAYHTVGLRSDGTVVAAGWNKYGQCDVDSWTNIVAIAAGGGYTIGLRSDGTVVATGLNHYGQCNVSGWKNIRLPQK